MKPKKALVVLNGAPCPPEFAQKIAAHCHFTACADGAWNWFHSFNLPVDLIAGDMDSIEVHIDQSITTKHFTDQNFTDFEKIIHHLIEKGFTDFDIIGGSGKEDDHFLSNLISAGSFPARIKISFLDPGQRILIINDNYYRFPVFKKETVISVFGWPHAEFIRSRGLFYPLDGLTMDFKRHGSRNRASAKEIIIEKNSGVYLLVINENPLYLFA